MSLTSYRAALPRRRTVASRALFSTENVSRPCGGGRASLAHVRQVELGDVLKGEEGDERVHGQFQGGVRGARMDWSLRVKRM